MQKWGGQIISAQGGQYKSAWGGQVSRHIHLLDKTEKNDQEFRDWQVIIKLVNDPEALR